MILRIIIPWINFILKKQKNKHYTQIPQKNVAQWGVAHWGTTGVVYMFIYIFYSWNFFDIDPDACVVFFAGIIPQSLFVTFLTIKRLIFIPL